MRVFIFVLCLFLSFSVDAQRRKKKQRNNSGEQTAMVILSQLGRTLYNYEVAATSSDKSTSSYEWRFILAEDDLRGKVNKNMAEGLSAFLFSFQPDTRKYNGEVIWAQEEVDKNQILGMIYQHLTQNIRYYKGDLDFVKIDGKYFYILYYPYDKNQLTKS